MTHRPMARLLPGLAVLLALAAAAPAAAATCPACAMFGETCTIGCLDLDGDAPALDCLSACETAVATCSCDESGPVTLSSEDAVRMGLAVVPSQLGGACHGTFDCSPEYSSCTNWSSYVQCGDPVCVTYKWCPDPPFCEAPDACFGPASQFSEERFRVCFNSAQQPCTEYHTRLDYPPLDSCGC